jgi:hypothetical protein
MLKSAIFTFRIRLHMQRCLVDPKIGDIQTRKCPPFTLEGRDRISKEINNHGAALA